MLKMKVPFNSGLLSRHMKVTVIWDVNQFPWWQKSSSLQSRRHAEVPAATYRTPLEVSAQTTLKDMQ